MLNDTLNMPCNEVFNVCGFVCTHFAHIIRRNPQLLVRELLPYATLGDVIYFLSSYFRKYSGHEEFAKVLKVLSAYVDDPADEDIKDQAVLAALLETAVEFELYWFTDL